MSDTEVTDQEKRITFCLYEYWDSLAGTSGLPALKDMRQEELAPFKDNLVLIDLRNPSEPPIFQIIGHNLKNDLDTDLVFKPINEVPRRTMLSRVSDHYLEVVSNRVPIAFEAEFINRDQEKALYRGILLPFSDDNKRINFILGGVRWLLEKNIEIDQGKPSIEELMQEIAKGQTNDPPKELEVTKPATDEMAAEEPATDELEAEEPATDELEAEEPATDEIEAEEPITDELEAEEPAIDELETEEPAIDELETEEPATDEIEAKEPAIEELMREITKGQTNNPSDELEAEEPATDEIEAEEPITDELEAEEPATDELEAKEPATDKTEVEDASAKKRLSIIEKVMGMMPTGDIGTIKNEENNILKKDIIEKPSPIKETIEAEIAVVADKPAVADVPKDVKLPSTDLKSTLKQIIGTIKKEDSNHNRSRESLYNILAAIYGFYEHCQEDTEAYSAIIKDHNLKIQARAPFTPILKLCLGQNYDKTRLTEYAAALSLARQIDISTEEFPSFIKNFPGGIKGCVKEFRSLKKQGNKAMISPAKARNIIDAKDIIRALPAIGNFKLKKMVITGSEPEFCLLLAKRDGHSINILKILDDKFTKIDPIIKQIALQKKRSK